MKITYHNYHFKMDGKQYLTSAVFLLRKLIQHGNKEFKNSFYNKSGDKVFVFQKSNNLYTLIVTKDNEIIKKLNSEKVSYDDIQKDLNANESVGFASYVFLDKDHYAIASTMQGPKNRTFVDFMNDLLYKLDINSEFISIPFSSMVSRDEVLELGFVGRTTFEINSASNAFKDLACFFGNGELPSELDAIEVTIKPRKGANIKDHIPALNNTLNEKGVNKYILRAKDNLTDSLEDFYVTGNGFISDYIDPKGEDSIATQIANKKASNEVLASKLEELRNDKRYIKGGLVSIARYNNDNSWIEHVSANYPSEIEPHDEGYRAEV